jgi:hypothetical protein
MGKPTCSIEDCDKPVKSRNWCQQHYDSWRRRGAPLAPAPPPLVERFWSNVDASGDCWEWTGRTGLNGYGRFQNGQRANMAHRWAWEHLVGQIPEGMQIDHLCRNHPCVNPDHLRVVTPLENAAAGYGIIRANLQKTHCPKGHPLTPGNLVRRRNRTHRYCLTCKRASNREVMRRLALRRREQSS